MKKILEQLSQKYVQEELSAFWGFDVDCVEIPPSAFKFYDIKKNLKEICDMIMGTINQQKYLQHLFKVFSELQILKKHEKLFEVAVPADFYAVRDSEDYIFMKSVDEKGKGIISLYVKSLDEFFLVRSHDLFVLLKKFLDELIETQLITSNFFDYFFRDFSRYKIDEFKKEFDLAEIIGVKKNPHTGQILNVFIANSCIQL